MKCVRLGLRWLLGVALAPIVLWLAVVTLMPTGWARDRLQTRLSETVGRPVHIGALRLGLLGGVWLKNLTIDSHVPDVPPWMGVGRMRVDLSLPQLVRGSWELSRVEAHDLTLRIHRRRDGTFEIGDLLGFDPDPRDPSASPPPAAPRSPRDPSADEPSSARPLALRLHRGRVILIDDRTETRLDCEAIEARGLWEDSRTVIHQFQGRLNGGRLELAAQWGQEAEGVRFEGQVRAEQVRLDVGMGALSYLVPLLAGAPAAVDGTLDLNLYLRGQGATASELQRSLVGQGQVVLEPIQIDGSPVVAQLSRLIDLPSHAPLGSIRSHFAIGEQRIQSDNLTVTLVRAPVVLSGWTAFDGRLDYRVRPEGLTGRLSRSAREILAELTIDLDELAALRVQGTLDELVVTINGVPVISEAGRDLLRRTSDRRLLRDAGRRLHDRIRR